MLTVSVMCSHAVAMLLHTTLRAGGDGNTSVCRPQLPAYRCKIVFGVKKRGPRLFHAIYIFGVFLVYCSYSSGGGGDSRKGFVETVFFKSMLE